MHLLVGLTVISYWMADVEVLSISAFLEVVIVGGIRSISQGGMAIHMREILGGVFYSMVVC